VSVGIDTTSVGDADWRRGQNARPCAARDSCQCEPGDDRGMTHSSRKVTKTGKASLGALTAIALAGTGLLGLSPAAAADDIVLTWRVTDSWTGGATIDATLSNRSATAVPWASSAEVHSSSPSGMRHVPQPPSPRQAGQQPARRVVGGIRASMNQCTPTGCSVPGHVPGRQHRPHTRPRPRTTLDADTLGPPPPTPTQPQPGGNLPTPVHSHEHR
jgi:hypothetical protein